jgi:hypothetical protein
MGNSPLIAVALFAAYQVFQWRLKRIVPDKRATPLTCTAGCEQFRSVFT